MSNSSRRKWLRAGLGAAAGASGIAVAARLAERYGLVPPDAGNIYGPGATLTYATQRLLTDGTMAREFTRSQISARPFANGKPLQEAEFLRLQEGGFSEWRLSVDGLVARPATFTLAELKSMPARSQITQLACEEGWSFIAEWTGVVLSDVLAAVGILPQARFVTYQSFQKRWRNSVDMADALHPQTLVIYGMNGGDLPTGHGGPLRMRVPRQLGYKSVKYINRLTVTDGLQLPARARGYAWYAGI
ncbi:MAG: molybdopterin-dependent oxidoreductase [Acidobacteria bacterium]|nr:molybdopterin-dependent oxidoreductase [Acidobacteriota bacterium]